MFSICWCLWCFHVPTLNYLWYMLCSENRITMKCSDIWIAENSFLFAPVPVQLSINVFCQSCGLLSSSVTYDQHVRINLTVLWFYRIFGSIQCQLLLNRKSCTKLFWDRCWIKAMERVRDNDNNFICAPFIIRNVNARSSQSAILEDLNFEWWKRRDLTSNEIFT